MSAQEHGRDRDPDEEAQERALSLLAEGLPPEPPDAAVRERLQRALGLRAPLIERHGAATAAC